MGMISEVVVVKTFSSSRRIARTMDYSPIKFQIDSLSTWREIISVLNLLVAFFLSKKKRQTANRISLFMP